MNNLKPNDLLTNDVKSAVNAYLLARCHAEVMRKQVNDIYHDILTECPVYSDKGGKEQILDPEDLWRCSDDALVTDAWAEANVRERAAGIKPDSMADGFCPALVAENIQRQAEHLLVDTAGPIVGITREKLLYTGLDLYQEFIDLIVGMVVNQPGFKNPLTKVA